MSINFELMFEGSSVEEIVIYVAVALTLLMLLISCCICCKLCWSKDVRTQVEPITSPTEFVYRQITPRPPRPRPMPRINSSQSQTRQNVDVTPMYMLPVDAVSITAAAVRNQAYHYPQVGLGPGAGPQGNNCRNLERSFSYFYEE